MRCINCGIATQRLRRHNTSSLPRLLLDNLAQWLTIDVPMDANICHPCFELLSSARAHDRRVLGYTMVCITCGRSVRSSQRHTVESHSSIFQMLPRSHPAFHENINYACHPCWMRHQRQTNNNPNRNPIEKKKIKALKENRSDDSVVGTIKNKKNFPKTKSNQLKRNNGEVSKSLSPVKTETNSPVKEVLIQVKQEYNDDHPESLKLECYVKTEPMDIKEEMDDTDDGPGEQNIEEPLLNEYDDYLKIEENEPRPICNQRSLFKS